MFVECNVTERVREVTIRIALCTHCLRTLCAYISKGERWERCLWQSKRPERVAAVDKIEGKRKSEDFIGHRNRIIQQRLWRCSPCMEPVYSKFVCTFVL